MAWWVWRQDDLGVEHAMLMTSSISVAEAVVADMERRGHKQVYTVRDQGPVGLGGERLFTCWCIIEETMLEAGTSRRFEDCRGIQARSLAEADALLTLHWQRHGSRHHRQYDFVQRRVEENIA
jgi:hypothetical protein